MTIWRAGMLAVCVDDGPRKYSIAQVDGVWHCEDCDESTPLHCRAVYRVRMVKEKAGVIALFFSSSGKYWLAERFRPLNDAPDDASLIERIKRCEPARKPVDA